MRPVLTDEPTPRQAAPIRGLRSTAQIAGHPIHPMLVPFPIAFLIGALLSDVAFWDTGQALSR